MAVAAGAMKAQQSRMRVIAENIANADSTALVAGGEPYRRQVPVFQSRTVDGVTGVVLAEVRPDQGDFRMDYDPSHPAANADGYVM
ncbi:MAG: flagellar basal body protein, partial [Brevundimonas sp.]|nr:flagellar basal body protein [Brevundimonas sp.]